MPPRDNQLPEGTDHIINGAMDTSGGGGSSGGGSTGGGGNANAGTSTGGGSAESTSGFIVGSTDPSGGPAGGGAGGGSAGNRGASRGDDGTGGNVVDQLKSQAFALKDQAGGRVREFADGGKTRASDALEELSRVFADTADSIDERLGGEYGEYARKASDTVSGFAETLRNKNVDEIYEEVTGAVRKSPGVAIGVAAVIGFALARVVKAGFEGDAGAGTSANRTNSGGTQAGSGSGAGS